MQDHFELELFIKHAMASVTKQSQSRSSLCAPDCCLIDLEITSCTKSFFSWGGAEDEVEEILCNNSKKSKKVYQQSQRRRKQNRDYPPPEIALSQSTASNSSSDVSSQFNDSTAYERKSLSKRAGVRNRDCIRNQVLKKDSRVEYSGISPPFALSRNNIRDYAALHEMLINSLFDDAQARHALKMGTEATSPPVPAPEISVQAKSTCPKPTIGLRKTSAAASIASSRTSRSRNSAQSKSSHHSEILMPSSHQFKSTLAKKRRKVCALPIFCMRMHKKKKNKNPSTHSHASGTASRSSRASPAPSTEHSPTPVHEELSSCASSNYTDSASSFLHTNCRLQKDKGKGVAPGNAIVALGRQDAMKKLGEKIDLLVEMERDGNWSNAALTRVPSRIIARDPKKSEDNNIIETRSMIGVKMGFVSVRYGIMIHWNNTSGQAELILLRKMCNNNFLKDRYAGKDKSSKIRMMGTGLVRKIGTKDLGTPSFVTVNSNELSLEDNSLGPPYLEPVESRRASNSLGSYE